MALERIVPNDALRNDLLPKHHLTPFLQALPGVPRAIINMSISCEVNDHAVIAGDGCLVCCTRCAFRHRRRRIRTGSRWTE
jgi:hypothetical protein